MQHYNLEDPDINNKAMNLTALSKLSPNIPRIMVSHDDNPQWKKPNELVCDKSYLKQSKVIFLVRDPRDVVVSLYYEKTKRVGAYSKFIKRENSIIDSSRVKTYEGDISSFILQEIGSIPTIVEFYNIWSRNAGVPLDYLMITYEDLHANGEIVIKQVFDFLGLDVEHSTIQEAVKFCSFRNMHEMEKNSAFNTWALRAISLHDNESYKTRKGMIGGYRNYLDEEQIQIINNIIYNELLDTYDFYKH